MGLLLLLTLAAASRPVAPAPDGTAALQAHADFTGQWILVDPADEQAGMPREIDVRGSAEPPSAVLTVTRRSSGEERSASYRVGLIGGVVSGISEKPLEAGETRPARWTMESAAWEGATLVIEQGWYGGTPGAPGPSRERREEWSLNADGTLVIVTTEQSSDQRPRRTTARYRRK